MPFTSPRRAGLACAAVVVGSALVPMPQSRAATSGTACATSSSTWHTNVIGTQTTSFTFDFDATPSAVDIDSVIGLTYGPATAYSNLAAIVRFNRSGTIDAVNGSSPGGNYTAAIPVQYAAGRSYHFRLSINPVAHTYSVAVTPPGGSATTIATNYPFRSDQASLSTFNAWATYAELGAVTVCNATVGSVSTAAATAPAVPTAPTNLTATTRGTSEVDLSWTGSTDASGPGVAGYTILRNGQAIGSASSTSYRDTTVAANASYSYNVQANDAAGDTSLDSNTATVTTPIWAGDLTTGNLSQYPINAGCVNAASVVTTPTPPGYRYAEKLAVADGCAGAGGDPRFDSISPNLFANGDDAYIGFSTYFPSGFPLTGTDWTCCQNWLQFAEIYGAPYNGSPSIGLYARDSKLAFGRDATHNNDTPWTAPFTTNTWYSITLHVKFSTDPSVGFVELWLNGVPQKFTNGSTRLYYDTLVPNVNWNGSTPNRLQLNQYRGPYALGTVTLYHAAAKVGSTYASVQP
jgi:hypothetical protein